MEGYTPMLQILQIVDLNFSQNFLLSISQYKPQLVPTYLTLRLVFYAAPGVV